MKNKFKELFKFFDIKDKEINGFLNSFGVNSIEELIKDDEKITEISEFFEIDRNWLYGKNEYLFKRYFDYYKNDGFCEEFINDMYDKLYIFVQRQPNKSFDEIQDGNYIYLIAEKEKEIFNGNKIKTYKVYDSGSGCRWGYYKCRYYLKKFLLCLKKNYLINKVIGIINEDIQNLYINFLEGKVTFNKLLGKMEIWYPEDYIEFSFENVNAKEEDELEGIIRDVEKIKSFNKNFVLIYKFKQYLIDVYGYKENEIIIFF